MKNNFIYIFTPIFLLFVGLTYRYFFLADTIDETISIVSENKILLEKYNRDVFIQNNVANLDSLYKYNKRGSKSYGDIIVELLSEVETMLKDSRIKYEANKINQDPNEIKDPKSGTTTFVIILSFEAKYDQISKFINKLETSKHVINIAALRMNRNRPPEPKSDPADKDTFDEFNVESSIQCDIRLEFVKYL
jgi:hypothetical protein